MRAGVPHNLRIVDRSATAPTPDEDAILWAGTGLPASQARKILPDLRSTDSPLADQLLAYGLMSAPRLAALRAAIHDCRSVDLAQEPPRADLALRVGVTFCQTHGVLPWRNLGGATIVATDHPARCQSNPPPFPDSFGQIFYVTTTRDALDLAIAECFADELLAQAEAMPPERFSCRRWSVPRGWVPVAGLGVGLLAWFGPMVLVAILYALAITSLLASSVLKIAALISTLFRPPPAPAPPIRPSRWPTVSVLVPLFREKDIAAHLLNRLQLLDYPRDKLDIVLCIEAGDTQTRETLQRTRVPPWVRTVVVPAGSVQTKPRAMNFALRFCRGEIIGIYDAEDAPEPDQIRQFVARFQQRPAYVACLQGVLDFYNPTENWIARCFTMEYAAWFRVLLPGLAQLGFVVPLGGTTVFFRRAALEHVGAWDAHNVTEDADLGVRLARFGYETEVMTTTTYEEANHRVWPWIKQRSRWLKGYAMTYAVHMRAPAQLWRDLGLVRFLGLQVQLCASLVQFALAPLLWLCWSGYALGWHPLTGILPPNALITLSFGFLATEGLTLMAGAIGLARSKHKRQYGWLPALAVYFPMATLAVYKGLYEMIYRPFYWDKTQHGHSRTSVLLGLMQKPGLKRGRDMGP